MTRGTWQLVTGHPLVALQYNALILLVPLVAWAAWRRQPISATLAVVLVAFAIVRNVPGLAVLRGPT